MSESDHEGKRLVCRQTLAPLLLRLALILAGFGSLIGHSHAGISSLNVMVVVNADDPTSVEIADRYMELRHIPATNRIDLDDIPPGLKIDRKDFLDLILRPVLEKINELGLAAQAQVIAYSSGFPTAVNISTDVKRAPDSPIKKYQLGTASLTGLTYLYQFLLGDDPNYLGVVSNVYSRSTFQRHFQNPFFIPELQKSFEQARTNRQAGRFTEAANQFGQLWKKFPSVAPLAILSAECFAEAKDTDSARKALTAAIRSGWRAAAYIRQTESLAGLIDEPTLAKLDDTLIHVQGPMAFDSRLSYLANGWPVAADQGGMRYLPSIMLAVVHPLGSTKEQAIAVLRRAAKSEDGLIDKSQTSFWFTSTKDVRTTTRSPAFPDALLWLGKMGYQTDVPKTAMPRGPGKVMGLMLGSPLMRPQQRKWKFLPGAISENLTSLSGAFHTANQDKITVLLHAGAALSCGPVTEPYTLPTKFPTPMTYGYYASGATSIEAIYLGLANPYQTIVVGDPLCRPMARPPIDRWDVTRDGKQISFRHRVPPIRQDGAAKVAAIQVYVNGRLRRTIRPNVDFKANVQTETDIVDLVLVADDVMQTRVLNPR